MKIQLLSELDSELCELLTMAPDTRVNVEYGPMHRIVWNLDSGDRWKFKQERITLPDKTVQLGLNMTPCATKVDPVIEVIVRYKDPTRELEIRRFGPNGYLYSRSDDQEESINSEMTCREQERTPRNRILSAPRLTPTPYGL